MKELVDPKRFVTGWRFLQVGLLVHIWIMGEYEASAFILILLLFVMASLRWRFRLPLWTVVFDAFMCLLYVPYADIGYLGLALPIFEFALKGKRLTALLLVAGLTYAAPSGFFFWLYFQALFFGIFSSVTLNSQRIYKLEADEQRKARHELERIKGELLEASRAASQQAELMERNRISRRLHDHLGHDLTGAWLALQAYEHVRQPEEAKQLLQEVKNRLERSTVILRETVHNMTTAALTGIENLDHIVRHFRQIEICYEKKGDMQLVSAHQWGLLEACLKEALTNVVRHSQATSVEVDVQVTESIARLLVGDNGAATLRRPAGSGLRSLQLRARAMEGSLSIHRENGFLLVCVLPLEKEGVKA
ncbi:sensor histidine kinase [Cohnella hongkongensis]|uniref:histidine kinase n=1 Tax=Cohnella hongkongensis TaxID=178337 RepID=A0ABV9F4J3_9BACL